MDSLEIEIYRKYQKRIGLSPRTLCVADEPRNVFLSEIIDQYDAFCFDGYGTLYNRGDFVYPSARDWYKMLREAGKQMRLVTNAASDVDAVLAGDAAKRGFGFTVEETISSGSLLKEFVEEFRLQPGNGPQALRQVFYIGRETGKNVLRECGIEAVENPESPVVAVSSAKDTPESYAHAVEILRRPGAMLLVLNSDAWAPKIDGSREPVSGALSERLYRDAIGFADDSSNVSATGCTVSGSATGFAVGSSGVPSAGLAAGPAVHYFGKPFPAIWRKVRESLSPGSRVLMIGDTLGTDVYGAYVAGFDSALVVGRNVPAKDLAADESALGVRPTYYLKF